MKKEVRYGLNSIIRICRNFSHNYWIAAYFIPTIIAFKKERDNKVSILALNLLLGWSMIGWVVSLVWALKEA